MSRDSPDLLQTVLSNSQELDSGVGRTDESTRNEESSEHDLLGDDHTSASNTNATNTPGSMRRFLSGRGDAPSLLLPHDLQFSTDSLFGLDGAHLEHVEPPYAGDSARMAMPGLTEQECERYKELLEIKCYYEKYSAPVGGQGSAHEGGGVGGVVSLDVNRNENLSAHELALLEEELRHLEFKCRNILRAQKMQQLRERCRKAWPPEEKREGGAGSGGAGSGCADVAPLWAGTSPASAASPTSTSSRRGSATTRTAPAPTTPGGRAAGARRWSTSRAWGAEELLWLGRETEGGATGGARAELTSTRPTRRRGTALKSKYPARDLRLGRTLGTQEVGKAPREG
ncbi:hypothetical protein fugu_006975 [Takifugu bimaculatus]|uniref:Uncharacterized protein n=1 Tax=Takifugu bimaculatus TaxID=433685 RepID=A0A4Z2B430_9TELE|nr:hypothetical protein fugu_006975 [Takifugu bimaculatus]